MSKRLQAIVDMVDIEEGLIIDIGTDHALLPIEIAKKYKNISLLATDIRDQPLERANKNIRDVGLDNRIELRLSDGFEKCQEDNIKMAIISGMGARLICDILARARKLPDKLILSPHTDQEALRRFLKDLGYKVSKENIIYDEGHYYIIIKAIRAKDSYRYDSEYMFGKININESPKELKKFIKNDLSKTNTLIDKLYKKKELLVEKKEISRRISQLEERREYCKEYLSFYEKSIYNAFK